MGIQLPHNIGIRLAHFFCILNFLRQIYFFFSMYFCGKWVWSPPDNATPWNFSAPKSWVSDLSLEGHLFLYYQCFFQNIEKWYYFLRKFWNSENNLIKKIFSSLFQYCERTIASTKSKICSYHINYCADLKLH